MNRAPCLAGLALALYVAAPTGSHSQTRNADQDRSARPQTLCGLLESIEPGAVIEVVLDGAFFSGYESTVFFDPEELTCQLDVQPATWVDLSVSAQDRNQLEEALASSPSHTALVRFSGHLYGPRAPGATEEEPPESIEYLERSVGRRYGHNGAFRTRLLVERVLKAAATGDAFDARPVVVRPEASEIIPIALHVEHPHYPRRGQLAGAEGDVEIEISVAGGEVVTASPLSGDRLLIPGALANVRTWRFDSEIRGRWTVTYEYRLELRPSGGNRNTKVELDLPRRIRLVGARESW